MFPLFFLYFYYLWSFSYIWLENFWFLNDLFKKSELDIMGKVLTIKRYANWFFQQQKKQLKY